MAPSHCCTLLILHSHTGDRAHFDDIMDGVYGEIVDGEDCLCSLESAFFMMS